MSNCDSILPVGADAHAQKEPAKQEEEDHQRQQEEHQNNVSASSAPPKRGIVKERSSSLRSAGSRRISCSRSSRVLLARRRLSSLRAKLRRTSTGSADFDAGELDQSNHLPAAFLAALAASNDDQQGLQDDDSSDGTSSPSKQASLSSLMSEDQNALRRLGSSPDDLDSDDDDDGGSDSASAPDDGNSDDEEEDEDEQDVPAGRKETDSEPVSPSTPMPHPPTAPPSAPASSLRSCMAVRTLQASLDSPSKIRVEGGITNKQPEQPGEEGETITESTRSLTTSMSTVESSTRFRKISSLSSELSSCAHAPGNNGIDSNSKPTKRNHVGFSTIEVREYSRTLGDNPAVTSGPPVTIEWEYNSATRTVIAVDEYESSKPPPRAKYEIVVPRSVREEWLRGSGFSRMEIAESVKAINREKRKRHQTVQSINGGRDKLDETVERVGRGLGRVLLRKPSSKALYNDWLQSNTGRVAQTSAMDEEERADAARRSTWSATAAASALPTADGSSIHRQASLPVQETSVMPASEEINESRMEGTDVIDNPIVAKEPSGDLFEELVTVANLGVPAGV
eukprot:CAMPEP_0178605256 /NCGR_PEP_ID=MMETSP0697-20121206/36472_1 /TAXON_ID=265572 /ORGANISM="Extubocellulus spinifer, Strain CCMP396" /LENGTH=566 /DNA_ID=CAMNT_0020243665 /DNA_START=88 /DNA_END=1789 /DNA_ORIENTATION=+